MPRFVEIAVNVPQTAGVFHYHLPPELEGLVQPGQLVSAPFGRQTVQGVVLGFIDQPEVSETRPVLDIVDVRISLTAAQIELARWLARECLAPLAACIGLMLPPGVEQQADQLYSLRAPAPAGLTPTQTRLVNLLQQHGPLRGQQIDRHFPRADWRQSARTLARRGLLEAQPVLPEPKVRPRMGRKAELACPPDQAEAALPELGRAGSKALERRQAMLRQLLREPGPLDLAWLYAESGGSLEDVKFLAGRGLVRIGESEQLRDPLAQSEYPADSPLALTRDQQAAWQVVEQQVRQAANGEAPPPVLLHGVTGSGKTEIYLQAVQACLALGRQAIVLVPEIALTPQTVRRFAGRFPGQTGLVHSGLSPGERYDTWRRARAGELSLVVGPRSALFTPFPNLGLIVVDEFHDDSYYQQESAPSFHAAWAAQACARISRAACLLGSATPDVESMQRCQQEGWHYLHLPARILAHRQAVQAQLARLPARRTSHFQPLEADAQASDLPPVTIVDMRAELKAGNRSIFSQALHSALGRVLEAGEQAILFLNRRGAATYIFCRDCGQALKCPRCDVPLTFHEAENLLRCHYCSYQRKPVTICPACGSTRIRQYGTGTQRVESEVQTLFPQARTLRWDHETTRQKGAHEAILSHFAAHRADVLVGTQMLAKGLDLPLVTLVGIVLADVGLSLPDYRAGERTFQVLTQVAGRAGRSPLGGQVLMQTFQPEHYVIRAAAGHDYTAFYTQELAYRQKLGYPPFVRLVRLEYRHLDAQKAEAAANQLGQQIQTWLAAEGRRATRIIGPAPCFFARVNGMHRWQIVLAGPDPAAILRGRALNEWKIEVNPPNLL